MRALCHQRMTCLRIASPNACCSPPSSLARRSPTNGGGELDQALESGIWRDEEVNKRRKEISDTEPLESALECARSDMLTVGACCVQCHCACHREGQKISSSKQCGQAEPCSDPLWTGHKPLGNKEVARGTGRRLGREPAHHKRKTIGC